MKNNVSKHKLIIFYFLLLTSNLKAQNWFYQILQLNSNKSLYLKNEVDSIKIIDSLNSITELLKIDNGNIVKRVKINHVLNSNIEAYEYKYTKNHLVSYTKNSANKRTRCFYQHKDKLIKEYLQEDIDSDTILINKYYLGSKNELYQREQFYGENYLYLILTKLNNTITAIHFQYDTILTKTSTLYFNAAGNVISIKDEVLEENYLYSTDGKLIKKEDILLNIKNEYRYTYYSNNLLKSETFFSNGILTGVKNYFYFKESKIIKDG